MIIYLIPETFTIFVYYYCFYWGHAVEQLVEALRYKPEGRGFGSRWFHWIFSMK